MNINKLLLIFSIMLCSTFFSFAQDNNDSTYTNKHKWFNWTKHSDIFSISFHGDPTISLNYGQSKISLKNANDKFIDPKLLEFKIGYTREDDVFEADDIFSYKYRYFTLGYISSEMGGNSNGLDINTKLWRAGLIKSSGYGYDLGRTAIIFYNSSGIMWSRPEVHRPNFLTFAAVSPNRMDDISGTVRFGTTAEGGIRFEVSKMLTLEAGYERSIIFPRHLFGKWVVSAIIEDVAQSFVDRFVDEIFDSSPQVAPVVNFVLKNALSYGIYELRQDKMNWPFNTEPGIGYDQFKFGVTFVF